VYKVEDFALVSAIKQMIPHIWLDATHVYHRGSYLHPEHPNRVLAIQERMQTWDPKSVRFHISDAEPINSFYEKEWSMLDGDTYRTEATPLLLERGHTMIGEAAETLATGETNCVFVLIRPPGHHAANNRIGGFCHQNNAWIAVQALRIQGLKRIVILDWDAHHGDGTEQCVQNGKDPNVRFCSMHAFGRHVYPGTGKRLESRQILNLPFPIGTESECYLDEFYRTTLPFVGSPDAIIVSAGYDGHEKDPMQLLRLQEATYAEMASALKEIGCPLLFLLEGGYQPDVLASCVEATLKPWLVLT